MVYFLIIAHVLTPLWVTHMVQIIEFQTYFYNSPLCVCYFFPNSNYPPIHNKYLVLAGDRSPADLYCDPPTSRPHRPGSVLSGRC